MRFGEPMILWGLLMLPLWVFWLILVGRNRRNKLHRFAGQAHRLDRFDGMIDIHRRWAAHLLWLFFFVATVTALARPQWGGTDENVERTGIDCFFIMDTSRSMAVEDVAPNRLGLARHAAGALLARISEHRVGLIGFAGEAGVQCPLTLDHAAVKMFLQTIEIDSMPVPGTALAGALETALQRFKATEDPDRVRAIVIFTDGEDHEGGLEELYDSLRDAGIPVFTVGLGTAHGGPIPLRDSEDAVTGYKKDSSGQIVTSRLDELPLRELSRETGAAYYVATPAEKEIEDIARTLSSMKGSGYTTSWSRRFRDRFQWPLGLALLALLVQGMISEVKRSSVKGAQT